MPPPAETLRDARYALIRVLGEGSQATTFEAVDKRAGSLVAIKRFQVRGAKTWKEVELAEREALVLRDLHHPALPQYVEHFEEGGNLYLVTTKIEGMSLDGWRRAGRPFREDDALRLLFEAAAALDYLHGRTPPIVHRDLKPSNVIRRPDGSFVFIDFGAVRDRMKPQGGSTVVGTFGYMAPEQFQGRAMPASDVYAIGATTLSMLTGQEPEDLPHKGLSIDVPAALAGVRVRRELVELLSRMLEPDPDRRLAAIGPSLAWAGRFPRKAWPPPRRDPARPPEAPPWEGPGGIPPALLVLAVVALTFAQIAVMVVLQGVLPLILAMLGMKPAASATRRAGGVAVKAIGSARTRVRHHNDHVAAERAAASVRAKRVRVEVDAANVPAADETRFADHRAAEDEARAAEAESNRMRRR